MRLFYVGLGLALSLAAPAQAGLFGPDWDDDEEKSMACWNGVKNAPELAAVNVRLARRDPTFAQLADEGLPSEQDAQLIRLRVEKEEPCRVLQLEQMERHRPALFSAMKVRFFQMDLVYLQLVQRRISFGNANRLMHEAYLAFSQHEDRYLAAQSEAQRRALAKSLDDLARQVQAGPPPPPGSGRLTCRWIGPTLYCDPY